MYPTEDSEGRRGMYCEVCGTIFYVPENLAPIVRERECPICGSVTDKYTSIRWICNAEVWQPDGDGF